MDWFNIISTVGFPIACCIALALYVKTKEENYRKDIKDLTTQHNQEMNDFRVTLMETINKNTIAIAKLTEKIDCIGGEKNETK